MDKASYLSPAGAADALPLAQVVASTLQIVGWGLFIFIAKFNINTFIKKVATSFSFLKGLLTSPLKYDNMKIGLKLN